MSDTMQLEIVTATQPPIKTGIKQLYIPAYLGEAGILENHKPYISLLKPGEISYVDIRDKNFYLYIREGFLEVNDNKIVIVSDSVEKGETLAADKEEIEKKLLELDRKVKSYLRIAEGATPEEIKNIPKELEKTLEEQKEFKIKQKIIQKIEEEK